MQQQQQMQGPQLHCVLLQSGHGMHQSQLVPRLPLMQQQQ
jgi:hypothetical protein